MFSSAFRYVRIRCNWSILSLVVEHLGFLCFELLIMDFRFDCLLCVYSSASQHDELFAIDWLKQCPGR